MSMLTAGSTQINSHDKLSSSKRHNKCTIDKGSSTFFMMGKTSSHDMKEESIVLVEMLNNEKVVQIACAKNQDGTDGGKSFVLTSDGLLKEWGPREGYWDSVKHKERTFFTKPIMNVSVV
jgi:hypothetical protein